MGSGPPDGHSDSVTGQGQILQGIKVQDIEHGLVLAKPV